MEQDHSHDAALVKSLMDVIYRNPGVRSATAFYPRQADTKYRVRATVTHFRRKGDVRIAEVRIQRGRPNYAERKFLKLCKRTGSKPKRIWISRIDK